MVNFFNAKLRGEKSVGDSSSAKLREGSAKVRREKFVGDSSSAKLRKFF
jgi:hypothetical protein